jgi:TRAP-type C4-dicarboxylate transport system permease small subunit
MFFRAVGVVISVLEVFCTLLMVTMAVIVLLGVFYRYVIERALPWYDEFAEFLLVWLTFYGSILAAHRRAHIGFETLTELLPSWGRWAVALVGETVMLLIQVALFVYGLRLVEAASFDAALSIRSVRLSWVYSAIPIAGAFMFLISLRRIAALVMAPRS